MDKSLDRLQAMLCLTAFHDIMKVQALCPKVSPAHAPYEGYEAGDPINDHDIALAYVLEFYPDLLPSFRALPQASRDVILFTQGKMHFNHGWFVQAEAPPGAMLSRFKSVLEKARPVDLAFYFFHWLTDLSGAEGQPLAGAEKFVLRFPRSVLSSFLWSIPYLQNLTSSAETKVVEKYLEARFEHDMPGIALPHGDDSIALMRLVVMAQSGGPLVLEAFPLLPSPVQHVLSMECARTGIEGQRFERSPREDGPALFVYYGPALLQRCTTKEEMGFALQALASVYHAARLHWPASRQCASQVVSLEAGSLKVVSFLCGSSINTLVRSGATFCAVDLEELW
mmetsp:Transcript_114668/g.370749  ORF Transcript_114668/g.370749 Transcript_114668/m.370749 type:complete len:339 (+) Transcript_114668:1245-2261(+)